MNNYFKNLFKLLLILLNSFNCLYCGNLNVVVNPNCPNNCTDYEYPVNLVHITSTGDKSIINYLWSAITCIPPTLLIVETELNSKLNITHQGWDLLAKDPCGQSKGLKDVITFTKGTVINSMGFQFSRLFIFNDNDKKGSFAINDTTIELQWKHFIWQNDKQIGSDSIQFKFQNKNKTLLYNGTISFDLRVDKSEGRGEELPHLAFTEKSVSLQISANDVQTEQYFKQFNQTDRPRLMADIFVMTGGKSSTIPDFDEITSIDDEYTPGVFRRIVLDLKNVDKEVKNSFLSWKPIAYNNKERIIANTLDVIHGKVEDLKTTELNDKNSRIFEAFFDVNQNPKYKFNLTFGASDDETYYNEQRINAFSMVVGVDSAPDEELSFLVKIIIVVGFGLPALVMIVSALYLIVRKIRKRKFNDLLLSQSQTLND